jgi:hypothetical protein
MYLMTSWIFCCWRKQFIIFSCNNQCGYGIYAVKSPMSNGPTGNVKIICVPDGIGAFLVLGGGVFKFLSLLFTANWDITLCLSWKL